MDPLDPGHQAPEPDWMKPSAETLDAKALLRRVEELEEQVRTYEALLNELPDLFERKFQQRLEPLLERYRLLAEQSSDLSAGTPPLVSGGADSVVRLPIPRIPELLRRRRRSV